MNGIYSDQDNADLKAAEMLHQLRRDAQNLTYSGWLIVTRAAFYIKWHGTLTQESYRERFPVSTIPENLTATLCNRVEAVSE